MDNHGHDGTSNRFCSSDWVKDGMVDLTREDPMPLEDAAAWLRVTRKTIDRWRLSGLETFKLGGKRYTTRSAINRFKQPDHDAPGPAPVGYTAEQLQEAERIVSLMLAHN